VRALPGERAGLSGVSASKDWTDRQASLCTCLVRALPGERAGLSGVSASKDCTGR